MNCGQETDRERHDLFDLILKLYKPNIFLTSNVPLCDISGPSFKVTDNFRSLPCKRIFRMLCDNEYSVN